MNRRLFVCLSIVVLGVAAYANSLEGPYLFDDEASVVNNRSIRCLWPPWQAAWGTPESPMAGRPLVNFSLAYNHALGGLDPRGYRAFNLAVHVLCAIVFFAIVDRTLQSARLAQRFGRRGVGIASACAILWLLHPMHTECVNYITQRTETMMALCYLLTMYCALRADDRSTRWRWSIAAVGACAAGMACKEVMVSAPVMVLLYDWTYRSTNFRQTLVCRWPLYAGLAATWAVLAALMLTGPRSTSVGFHLGVSAFQYALNQCVILVDYLRLVFWPNPVILDYGYPLELTFAEVAPYAAALAILVTASFAAMVRRPAVGFPAVWFFVVIAPTSSFVPIVTEVGAERRIYLPSTGLIALIAVCACWLLTRANKVLTRRGAGVGGKSGTLPRRVGATFAVVLGAVMLLATAHRNVAYQNPLGLWQTSIEAMPQNPRAHLSVGSAEAEAGRLDEALEHYRRALLIKPDFAMAHFDLGNLYLDRGHLDDAIRSYESAAQYDPGMAAAWNQMGIVLATQGNHEEAITKYDEALRIDPMNPEAHFNLAHAMRLTGRLDEAIKHYEITIREIPRMSGGRPVAALKRWLDVIKSAGDDAQRHLIIATYVGAERKLDEAIIHYGHALRLRPDRPEPRARLAWILATSADDSLRDAPRALELAQNAAQMTGGRDPVILDVLAAAYAESGQFDRAVASVQRAIELAEAAGGKDLAAAMRPRLEHYRKNKPWRQE